MPIEERNRFKFRHWDKQINKMRYGDIQLSCDGNPFILEATEKGLKVVDIEDVITMLCTGLKDAMGRLIYENDILLSPDMDEPYRIIVEWDNEKGYIIKAWNGKEFEYALSDDEIEDLKSFEIIGNGYENPELLEVENAG